MRAPASTRRGGASVCWLAVVTPSGRSPLTMSLSFAWGSCVSSWSCRASPRLDGQVTLSAIDPKDGMTQECLPGPPATMTLIRSGLSMMGIKVAGSLTSDAQGSPVAPVEVVPPQAPGQPGPVVEVELDVPAATSRPGRPGRVLGAEDAEELGPGHRGVVGAQGGHDRGHLLEDRRRRGGPHVVGVVRALGPGDGHRAGGVDADAPGVGRPGLAAMFSAKQNPYLAGWPWVQASPSPG